MEARVLMMSTNNILSPANGKPIINPTQDIVLGLYYATRERKFARGCYREGKLKVDKAGKIQGYLKGVYSSPEEVRMAYDNGEVTTHAGIRVRVIDPGTGKRIVVDTTVGRCLISEILPDGLPFELINKTLDKKALSHLIDACYRMHRNKETVLLADRLRTLGFEHATRAGISICMDHMVIPDAKKVLLDEAQSEVEQVVEQYQEGLITDGERYNKIVDIWAGVADKVTAEMMNDIGKEKVTDPETGKEQIEPSFNPIYIMADSGARGSTQQIRQLAAMRGLMAKPSGEIIETPITANFREGLTVLQYFISTHGARKGLADTALKTANSGYLTRRLVDVAQDAVITEFDCGTLDGIRVAKLEEAGEVIQPLGDRILGRVALEDVVDPLTGEVIVAANTELDEDARHARSRRPASRRSSSARCSPARPGAASARSATDATSRAATRSTSARRSASSPPSRSASRARSSRCARSTSVVRRRAARSSRARSRRAPRASSASAARTSRTRRDGTVVVMNRHGELVIVDDTRPRA